MLLGRIDTILGRPEDARSELENAAAIFGSLNMGGREGSDFRKELGAAYNNLGAALIVRGDHEGAVALLRKALEEGEALVAAHPEARDHRRGMATAHLNLGGALLHQDDHRGAAAQSRKALEGFEALVADHPDDRDYRHGVAVAHRQLGYVLRGQGNRVGASEQWRKALEGYAELAAAHPKVPEYNEGEAMVRPLLDEILRELGKPDEAIALFREDVRLNPKSAAAHFNLAVALFKQGEAEEAIVELGEATKLDGDHLGEAIFGLADLLGQRGRYDEAITKLRRARDLARRERRPDAIERADGLIERFSKSMALATRLPGVIRGDEKPRDAVEELAFAEFAGQTKRFGASARLFADAFQSDPKLAENITAQNRYKAACAAVRAAIGQEDVPSPMSEPERARWRKQALAWLEADLAHWTKLARSGPRQDQATVKQTLDRWKVDPALAAIRDEDSLKILPEDERKACRSLWAGVDALLETVGPR